MGTRLTNIPGVKAREYGADGKEVIELIKRHLGDCSVTRSCYYCESECCSVW